MANNTDLYEILDGLESKIDTIIANQNALSSNQAVIVNLINALEVSTSLSTQQEITYPYDFTSSKMTYPDASEIFYPDFLVDSEFIQFGSDGAVTYSIPFDVLGTTSGDAKYSRMETRFMKVTEDKTQWNWKNSEVVGQRFIVVFHELPDNNTCVFTQLHGVDSPYFKVAAGKGSIRVLCKTREGLSGDDIVETLSDTVELNVPYLIDWTTDGTTLNISIDNVSKEITFDRTDDYYPKAGCYGKGPASCTHVPV